MKDTKLNYPDLEIFTKVKSLKIQKIAVLK